jgi:hypothetical protein
MTPENKYRYHVDAFSFYILQKGSKFLEWFQNTYYHTQLRDIRFGGVTVAPTSKFCAFPATVGSCQIRGGGRSRWKDVHITFRESLSNCSDV